MYEDNMVCLCPHVAHFQECASYLLIPNVPALLCAVHALLEFEDVPFGDVKTRGWFHVEVLLEIGVEIGGFDVHLMDFEVMLGC